MRALLLALLKKIDQLRYKSAFEIRQDEHGIGDVLIVKGTWSESIGTFMRKYDIKALRLSDFYDFNGHDLSFLSSLTFLRSLDIFCWEAQGLKVIESLPQLEVLCLQYKSNQQLDLSSYSKLKVAKLRWSKGLDSLLTLPSIELLSIQNYPYEDLTPLKAMTRLKRLDLTSRKLKSLTGIQQLSQLEILDLYNCPFLTSLNGTEQLNKLHTLEINACKRITKEDIISNTPSAQKS